MSIRERLEKLFGRGGQKMTSVMPDRQPENVVEAAPRLPRSVLAHDPIDHLVFENYTEDSPRFRKMTVEDAPTIPVGGEQPQAPDMASCTPAEFKEYQQALKTFQDREIAAPPYDAWRDLTRDVFASYHTHNEPELSEHDNDPSVDLHRKILPKLYNQEDHAHSRHITRDNPVTSALATMAAIGTLKQTLEGALAEETRHAEEFREQAQEAAEQQSELQDLRDQAAQFKQQGVEVPNALRQAIKEQVKRKRQMIKQAMETAEGAKPMTQMASEAIQGAAKAAKETAESAQNTPSFGQGFGGSALQYESPEQALSIAEQWASNEKLRKMAALFGRLERDIRFRRSKRVVGGREEIVDVAYGDELQRILPSEWALFADPEFEDDFLSRFAAGETLVFSTVGEEDAGRGPVVFVGDASYSMAGEPNIWMRAVAMSLLSICRREKRDFAFVEFSTSSGSLLFGANKPLDPQQVLEMCSRFEGGGTVPMLGMQEAKKWIDEAPEFKAADVVIVGDGEASFGPEDERLREHFVEKGVRIHGIGIGGSFSYLNEYCESVVSVDAFELSDPNAATAQLAVSIS
jgi:uncharacterized protein with von Willebrand factor type A (vWA) domain